MGKQLLNDICTFITPLMVLKFQDIRRCIFCNRLGDGDECNTGRLLYAGVNEWVHVNCALWSAEVYEDDHGRLKHVHDALKRGNKLVYFCDSLISYSS